MADRTMDNVGTLTGTYNNIPFADSPSSEVSVTLADVPFQKTADRTMWFSGNLEFTLTVDNTDGDGPLGDIVIEDQLDLTMFSLIMSSISVEIDGTALVSPTDYTVSYTGGLLTITLVPTIELAVGSVLVVKFKGAKVP